MDYFIVLCQLVSLVSLVAALIMCRTDKAADKLEPELSDYDRLDLIMKLIDQESNSYTLDMLEILVQQRRILCYVERVERTARLASGTSNQVGSNAFASANERVLSVNTSTPLQATKMRK